MYIKSVFIKNLWQKGDITWNMEPDVNILVGINGSGKSTILNLIFEALQSEISDESKKRYFSLISELTIRFSDDTFVIVDSSGDRFPTNIDHLELDLMKISTFDISNSLDDLISDLQLQFEIYQKNLYKRFEESLKPPKTFPTGEEVIGIFGRRKIFIDTLNNLFKDSGKSFSEDTFSFKLENQKYELSHRQLSSGEKQVFYIMLQTLIQNGQPFILLLDEPEISLHIEWQRELLFNIRQLNDKCQIVAVTHSSNMYYRGWLERKMNIEEIKQGKDKNQIRIDIRTQLTRFADEFKRITKGKNSDRILNDVNAMLHRTFYMLSIEDCKSILKTMSDANIKPDHFTYTTLISKTTNSKDAIKLLGVMKKAKITPNAVTYVNILKKTETFDDAMTAFDLMRNDRIEPAIQHFSTLLGKADDPEIVQRVEELRALYGVPANDIYSNKLRIKK